jgi:hypothetical protein
MARFDKEDFKFGPTKDEDEDIVENHEEEKDFDILSQISMTFREKKSKGNDLMGYKGIAGESYQVSALIALMYSKVFENIENWNNVYFD